MTHHPATVALIRAAVDLEHDPTSRAGIIRALLAVLTTELDGLAPGRPRAELFFAASTMARAAGTEDWLALARGLDVLAGVELDRRFDA